MSGRQRFLVAFSFLLALAPATADAAPACGDTVGGEGQTVILDGNVGPCSESAALFIAPGTVAVDLAGFTVSCASEDSIGISSYDPGHPIEVRGGSVTGCGRGVDLLPEERGGRIVGMTLDGNGVGFVGDSCESSIATNSTTHGMILFHGKSSDCHASGNGQMGFLLWGAKISLSDSTASMNGFSGVASLEASCKLSNITSNDNDGNGIQISGSKSRIDGCTTNGNHANGIALTSSDTKPHRIRNSHAEGNTLNGLELGRAAITKSNVATNNGGYGIHVTTSAHGIRVRRSIASGNVTDLVSDNTDCYGSKWSGNTFDTSNASCIH